MADADAATIERDETVKLQVAGARQEESGQGFARISREIMVKLGIVEGDIIEIEGKRTTAARALLSDKTIVRPREDVYNLALALCRSREFSSAWETLEPIRRGDSNPAFERLAAQLLVDLGKPTGDLAADRATSDFGLCLASAVRRSPARPLGRRRPAPPCTRTVVRRPSSD